MNIPITFGWPQFLLLIIALIGLGLLISSSISLLRPRFTTYEDETGQIHRRRRRRRFKIGRAVGGVFILLIAVSLIWLTLLLESYIGLTSEIKVAQIHASTIANAPHEMNVELTLYDGNGNATYHNTYLVNGDEWILQGDIIKFPGWLNVLGLHSGYKLTRLEGRFDDIKMERTSPHTAVELNGGDDNFFKTMHNQGGWLGAFVDTAYGNAVIIPPDGTYNVTVTQDSLIARRVP